MNAGRKKGLGRGLSALFGDATPEEKTKNGQSGKTINNKRIR